MEFIGVVSQESAEKIERSIDVNKLRNMLMTLPSEQSGKLFVTSFLVATEQAGCAIVPTSALTDPEVLGTEIASLDSMEFEKQANIEHQRETGTSVAATEVAQGEVTE